MSSPTPQNNIVTTQHQLKDAFNILKKEIFLTLNCHHVGKVQTVDFTNQTLTATIMYKKAFTRQKTNGVYETVYEDYPTLIDVPFIVLSGGSAYLKMPIKSGDECLLLFNDRAIDNWWASGQNTVLSSSRLHSFSDAIALVGIKSLSNSIQNYDSETLELINDEGFVNIKENKIGIGNGTSDLLTVLSNLITVLVSLTTTNAVPGAPCALSPTTIAALNNITTQLQGILR